MATNFWKSTHYKNWVSKTTKSDIRKSNPLDTALTKDEVDKINEYCYSLISELGKKAKVRQNVIASATIFYRRFYLKNSFIQFDPRLVSVTVLYIAAKTEECGYRVDVGMNWIRQLSIEKSDALSQFKPIDILDCEFYIVDCLNFDLVLFHPYKPLTLLLAEMNLEEECLKIAWDIVNDSYRTSAILMYPPYIIALAAIYLALIKVSRDATEYIHKLNVNSEQVEVVVQILLEMYKDYRPTSRQELERVIQRLNSVAPTAADTERRK